MNQTQNTSAKAKNIYARGADDGFWLGLYLCALFFVCTLSLTATWLNVVAFGLIVGVPPLIYFFLRRTHVAAHGMTVFSALWMQGIVTFACGCLILGAVSFVYLRWVDPDLIRRALLQAIEVYESTPGEAAEAMASELKMISNAKAILAPLNVAFGWMWLGMFSGSLLSMLMAGVVKLRRVPVDRGPGADV